MPEESLLARLRACGLPPARLAPRELPFMLPTLSDQVPTDPGWLFEIKWDGVRVLVVRAGGRVVLRSRTLIDVTARYPEVAAGAAEIVALDAEGRPSFHRLQRRMHAERDLRAAIAAVPATAYAYDCLALHGLDVRSLPLAARKALVSEVVPRKGTLRYADHVETDGQAFFDAACAAELEGIVAKRADAPYLGGRRAEWRKVKCHRRQEFVVGGFTDPKGTREHLGALHLGVYDGDDLVYVGRAGSGLDARDLRDLHARLQALRTERCPFTRGAPPAGREHHWVRPVLVCEVRFSEWTPDGHLRHPIYLGLRADRPAREVRRETPATASATPRS
jgi:bifunctional non-homologous end joining protein LigD